MLYLIDMFGVAVFAVTGALVAGRKRMDLFGVIVIAIVTAVGGGTLRDLILNRPVFWTMDTNYLTAAIVAALLTCVYARYAHRLRTHLLVADAFGVAMFTVAGTRLALDAQVSGFIAVLMGVISSVAGSVIRDVLCNEIPLILRQEIYATASLAGAVAYVLLLKFVGPGPMTMLSGAGVVLIIRLAAIRWHLSLPPLGWGVEENGSG